MTPPPATICYAAAVAAVVYGDGHAEGGDAMSWPPLATSGDLWSEVAVRRDGQWQRCRARQVLLWGKAVFVNEVGDVYCDGCALFVPVSELGRPVNPHRVGLQSVPGALVPIPAEEPWW